MQTFKDTWAILLRMHSTFIRDWNDTKIITSSPWAVALAYLAEQQSIFYDNL